MELIFELYREKIYGMIFSNNVKLGEWRKSFLI